MIISLLIKIQPCGYFVITKVNLESYFYKYHGFPSFIQKLFHYLLNLPLIFLLPLDCTGLFFNRCIDSFCYHHGVNLVYNSVSLSYAFWCIHSVIARSQCNNSYIEVILQYFHFFSVLGFDLRVLCLLCHLSHTPNTFLL